jgi:hypothetical protein
MPFIALRGTITFDKSLFETSADDLLVHRFSFPFEMSSSNESVWLIFLWIYKNQVTFPAPNMV